MQMFPHPTPPAAPDIPLIDNVFVGEISTLGVSGIAMIGGVVTITLETVRCDHSKAQPTLERVVVGRVAASVPAAQALLTSLYDFLGQHGLNPLHKVTTTCQ